MQAIAIMSAEVVWRTSRSMPDSGSVACVRHLRTGVPPTACKHTKFMKIRMEKQVGVCIDRFVAHQLPLNGADLEGLQASVVSKSRRTSTSKRTRDTCK